MKNRLKVAGPVSNSNALEKLVIRGLINHKWKAGKYKLELNISSEAMGQLCGQGLECGQSLEQIIERMIQDSVDSERRRVA